MGNDIDRGTVSRVAEPAQADTALELAADCLATQLVRGFPAAIELSDQFAAAGVHLPLLNWPTSAAQPLYVDGSPWRYGQVNS